MNEQLLEMLKDARARAAESKLAADAILLTVKASPEYVKALDELQTASANVATLEENIRAEAIREFKATENKHPHPKVEIKMYSTFSITDPKMVLAWVKTNLADALVVDEKKVKAYATKIGPVDGTALTEEPKALIASEL